MVIELGNVSFPFQQSWYLIFEFNTYDLFIETAKDPKPWISLRYVHDVLPVCALKGPQFRNPRL